HVIYPRKLLFMGYLIIQGEMDHQNSSFLYSPGKEGDIMLCLDENVIPGQPIPSMWIYCANLSGRAGAFPGIFAEILYSPSKIDELLQRAPHAIATKTIHYPPDGYVQIDEGEALYIEKLDGDSVFGRAIWLNALRLTLLLIDFGVVYAHEKATKSKKYLRAVKVNLKLQLYHAYAF
ncbi:hypothetical protein ACTXT7_004822, partial [Hymenolepis weldensis]